MKIWEVFIDLIYPPRCVICGKIAEKGNHPSYLCQKCKDSIPFISPGHVCRKCGVPVEKVNASLLCASV